MSTIKDDLLVQGRVTAQDGFVGLTRADLQSEQLVPYRIHPTDWRKHDALAENLPGTPGTDDLGLYTGTPGTDFPYIWTGDVKTVTIDRKAACLFALPAEYEDGQAVRVRLRCGMRTNVADVSATLDLEAWLADGDGVISGSDLYTGAAININGATGLVDRDFQLSAGGLQTGMELMLRASLAVQDTATGTEVAAWITEAAVLLTIRG